MNAIRDYTYCGMGIDPHRDIAGYLEFTIESMDVT